AGRPPDGDATQGIPDLDHVAIRSVGPPRRMARDRGGDGRRRDREREHQQCSCGEASASKVCPAHRPTLPERTFGVKARLEHMFASPPAPVLASAPPRRRVATVSDITPRQQRIVDFIAETVRERGYPPTVRE